MQIKRRLEKSPEMTTDDKLASYPKKKNFSLNTKKVIIKKRRCVHHWFTSPGVISFYLEVVKSKKVYFLMRLAIVQHTKNDESLFIGTDGTVNLSTLHPQHPFARSNKLHTIQNRIFHWAALWWVNDQMLSDFINEFILYVLIKKLIENSWLI